MNQSAGKRRLTPALNTCKREKTLIFNIRLITCHDFVLFA